MEPAAGIKSQGAVGDQAAVAQWLNWLWYSLCEWVSYLNLDGTDELTYANTRTRTVMVSPALGVSEVPNPWVPAFSSGLGAMLRDATSGAEGLVVPLGHVLPDGATLTLVRAGVIRDGGVTGMAFTVYKQAANKTTPGAPAAANQIGVQDIAIDDPNGDVLTIGAVSEAVTKSTHDYLAYFAQSGSKGGADFDKVLWIEVTYTETRATGSH